MFLDVVEKANLLLSHTGQVVRGEIQGALRMKTFLSGMPECKLGLNDKVRALARRSSISGHHRGIGGIIVKYEASRGIFRPPSPIPCLCSPTQVLLETQGKGALQKAVDLEDIKFHQCVRLTHFERDRTISFIPPDGQFDLMTYRITGVAAPGPHDSRHHTGDPTPAQQLVPPPRLPRLDDLMPSHHHPWSLPSSSPPFSLPCLPSFT